MTKPVTTVSKPSLQEATRAMTAWRKRAESGKSAVPSMRASVERMNAAIKVIQIVNEALHEAQVCADELGLTAKVFGGGK